MQRCLLIEIDWSTHILGVSLLTKLSITCLAQWDLRHKWTTAYLIYLEPFQLALFWQSSSFVDLQTQFPPSIYFRFLSYAITLSLVRATAAIWWSNQPPEFQGTPKYQICRLSRKTKALANAFFPFDAKCAFLHEIHVTGEEWYRHPATAGAPLFIFLRVCKQWLTVPLYVSVCRCVLSVFCVWPTCGDVFWPSELDFPSETDVSVAQGGWTVSSLSSQ